MNKIIIDKEINEVVNIEKDSLIHVDKNINSNIIIWKENDSSNLLIELEEDSCLTLNIIGIDSNINICVDYLGENSKLYLNNSVINYSDSNIVLNINHDYKNTISDVVNHGININCGKLFFTVNASVKKYSSNCEVKQDNKIINLSDGNSKILPNLLIDEYDVSANHSAYISRFNDSELFYLMSRGISKKDSLYLLMKSFLINRMNLFDEIKSKFIDEIIKIEGSEKVE